MSGFEVAGIVLGSLPLIIAALEHYAEGVATAKRFWKYKSELRSLVLQINTERGIYINTLEQLLTGIVRVEHMADFLSNTGTWRDSDVEPKLKDRLRGAYAIYMDNVKGMEVVLETMMEKLALGADGKPQFSDPSAFKQEYKRLKFTISKSGYTELLTNLKNHNQALTRLTRQSLELEPSRTVENKSPCPNFKAVQNYARSLYATLRSSWCCGCPGHAVNLRLENRVPDALERVPFRVVFSYTSEGMQSASLPSWKEADIRHIEDKPKGVPLCPPGSTSSAAPVASTKRRVRFDHVELHMQQTRSTASLSSSSSMSSTTTLTTTVSSPSPAAHPTPAEIRDLCKAMARLQQPHRDLCIGYLLDGLNQWKHGIYPLEHFVAAQQQWTAYSLKDVLARNTNLKRRLTQHDKLRIAVDLSSSVLQLHKTPWLNEQWGKEDVFFIHRPGASPASVYEHPFVCQKFGTRPAEDSQCASKSLNSTCRVIRNQTLFTLGILLIELWYGKCIEELQMPCDLDCTGTPGVAWCTADRLVENELEFEAGKRYSDAVRRCIRCDFDRKDMSLDNESFQQAVYGGVVGLLETTLQQFSSLD